MLKKVAFLLLVLSSSVGASAQNGETCKNCDKVLLTENDLIDSENWSIMRNEIYAKRGLIFTNKNLTEYFQHAGWGYNPTQKDVTKSLNAIEKQNISFLQRYEKEGFSGFNTLLAAFRAAVLANNRAKILAMADKDVFVINPNNGRDDYADTFTPAVKKAFEKNLWKKVIIATDKTTELDGFKSCGRQFYFTKKKVNGKAKWLLISVLAPG